VFRAIWFINADTGFLAGVNKIQRTYDGGLTWSVYTTALASSLQDIVFTNDSLGYCAGSFGKILFTYDCGQSWFQTNNASANAAIEEMWFANDSVGYFAKQTSQSITIDSCKNVGTIATACLANNWTMNSISMTNGGQYGYCVGGLNGVIHQTEQREIYRTYTSVNEYCAGSGIFVAYYARGFYGATNVFTAQLSNASGSFANPVNIGTYTATPYAYQSGIIYAVIPAGTPAGNNYRIRVIASDPSTIGVDNGFGITIQPSFTPNITLNSSTNVPVCAGSNISFTTVPFAGGLNPIYSWTINGNTISNSSETLSIDTLQDGDVVKVSMQSNLNCASAAPVFSNTFVAAIITALPLTLANDTLVCENSSIQLNAPAGYNYNWSPQTGLSSATIANPIALISNDITYHLTITDAAGCVGNDSIYIHSNPLPQLDLDSSLAVCENSSIQLSAPAGLGYHWFPATGLSDTSIANPVATIAANIQYNLIITDSFGCAASDSVLIEANPLPQLILATDTIICENNCFTLSSTVVGNLQSILWSPASTLTDSTVLNPTACPNTGTLYIATVVDNNQCSTVDSVFIAVNPLPVMPSIAFDGVTLTASNADSYQWFVDSTLIIGANSIDYVPLVNGDYWVQVTNNFGCSNISDPFTVNINNVAQHISNTRIIISPNPVFDAVHVTLNTSEPIGSVMVFNAAGVKIYENNTVLNKQLIIDTKSFSSGIYIVVLKTSGGVYYQRVSVLR
jgi:hypothetical protein